jgi:nucleoside-diphosphate-sugar epimerase
MAGLFAPADMVRNRAFNVGIPNGNFTVRDLAEAAQASVPGSELIFTGEHGSDSRTYRVSFQRILSELADFYSPQWDLRKGGHELVEFYRHVGFTAGDYRGRKTIRLAQLKHLIETGLIDSSLRFKN